MTVTEPGIYDGMDEAVYHADPVPGGSLSSTGARKLLPPSCPAKFAAWRAEPPQPTPAMELGTAAHRMVLGIGPEIREVKFEDWRTNAAKAAASEARARGEIPLLTKDFERVRAMHDALQAHLLASAALDPGRGGKPEQSLFCREEAGPVWLRVRLDWMPDPDAPQRPVIYDYKTAVSAERSRFERHAYDLGYHVQAAMYAVVYERLTGCRAPFLWIVQEKEPPYLVNVIQGDDDLMRAGYDALRAAVDIYADCAAAGLWPGYPEDVHTISLPAWARRDYL